MPHGVHSGGACSQLSCGCAIFASLDDCGFSRKCLCDHYYVFHTNTQALLPEDHSISPPISSIEANSSQSAVTTLSQNALLRGLLNSRTVTVGPITKPSWPLRQPLDNGRLPELPLIRLPDASQNQGIESDQPHQLWNAYELIGNRPSLSTTSRARVRYRPSNLASRTGAKKSSRGPYYIQYCRHWNYTKNRTTNGNSDDYDHMVS